MAHGGTAENFEGPPRAHPLGKDIARFASQIQRHQGKTLTQATICETAPQYMASKARDRETREQISTVGKRERFLDDGEGKIGGITADTVTGDGPTVGYESDMEISDSESTARGLDIAAESDKVRDGNTPYLTVPRRYNASCSGPMAHTPANEDTATEVPERKSLLTCESSGSDGLRPPKLASTHANVLGKDKGQLRKENKARRLRAMEGQTPTTHWVSFKGDFYIPENMDDTRQPGKQMAPKGLATLHPAGDLLNEWSQFGCPTMTGQPWTKQEMAAAIARGPHKSALSDEALKHFELEIAEKVAAGQARVIAWADIEHDPPPQLKISPIAAVPHSSKPFRSILDLSFSLKLETGASIPAVNETTVKTAPQASIDQLGQSLTRIIHAFAETTANDKVFMAKWDVKDGFWRLMCQEGEEYNFAYVLPQRKGMPVKLVIPTSLQMGWIESPAYFCAASETSRDVAEKYCQAKMGSLPPHKFAKYMKGSDEYLSLPTSTDMDEFMRYMLEVFVDDFMSLVIAISRRQLDHVGTGTMMGIHDVFPESAVDEDDPISEKKMKKLDSRYATKKTLLGFDFDGDAKTMWLQEDKRAALLTILHGWIRGSQRAHAGIPFNIFESVTAKLRHAFTSIPVGLGLLSPCNRMLALKPTQVFLHRNEDLRVAISDIRNLLRASVQEPTNCKELVGGWPHFIGYTDASGAGFGGVVIGEDGKLPPTVFRGMWPPDIQAAMVSNENPDGTLSINDLEMAGFLITWLVMEAACPDMRLTNIALFSDNSPSVSWVDRLASRRSLIGARLIRALALRMKIRGVCPLTPLHVAGKRNTMADVASRSFGNVKQWHCGSDSDFACMFNTLFPLPNQNIWTVFRPTQDICMKVISILRMTDSSLDEWRRMPKIGRSIGPIGVPTSNLWEWTRSSNIHRTQSDAGSSLVLQRESEADTMVENDRLKLERSLQLSGPLARRSLWNVRETH